MEKKHEEIQIYLSHAAPVILYYAIFCYGPMGGTIIAFKNYKPALGITGSKMGGDEIF